ncbi:MAG: dual specificity protein phosphatase family protein [Candidatus Hydrogenedentes bacterium]|nr:dual specificity protein phosphatase family protein [Candidatus Hydrogenedentota bacterium]
MPSPKEGSMLPQHRFKPCTGAHGTLIAALGMAVLMTCLAIAAENAAERPEKWAAPIVLEGVPNLHKVSDTLYRSAQPTAEGMQNLKKLGVKTIVNLRSYHSDRAEIGETGLAYEHIYMKPWHPERKEIVRFLQIVTDPERAPVLVHCQHGAYRTGTMSAIYRIAVQGWTKEEALREMREGGFGFHEVWMNLPDWIEELDIESIKKDAGIENVTGSAPQPDGADEQPANPR